MRFSDRAPRDGESADDWVERLKTDRAWREEQRAARPAHLRADLKRDLATACQIKALVHQLLGAPGEKGYDRENLSPVANLSGLVGMEIRLLQQVEDLILALERYAEEDWQK